MPTTRKKPAAAAEESRPLTLPRADVDPTKLSGVALLHMAIAATPDPRDEKTGRAIPATHFAETVAKCNDRTLRRYLSGDRVVPALLREKLEGIVRKAARLSKAAP